MPISLYEAKRETLIAIYTLLHRSAGKVYFLPEEIRPFVDTNISLGFIIKALESLEDEELISSKAFDSRRSDRLAYSLSDEGILRSEQLTGNVDPRFGARSSLEILENVVVTGLEGDPSITVRNELERLEESIRTSNEAFPENQDDRAVAIAEVSSLRTILASTVVRIAAFKQKAASTLEWIAVKAASSAIAEACKHVLKLIMGWS